MAGHLQEVHGGLSRAESERCDPVGMLLYKVEAEALR